VQLLLRILPLERARDLRPLAALRARLRDLHHEFFTLYMADRTVKHGGSRNSMRLLLGDNLGSS
jgi:hypothetical protein